jgi:hypothetical protein
MNVSLIGCKQSDVLVEIIQDQRIGETDYSLQPLLVDVSYRDQDPDFKSPKPEEDPEAAAQDILAQLPNLKLEDLPTTDETAAQQEHDKNATSNLEDATSGGSTGAGETPSGADTSEGTTGGTGGDSNQDNSGTGTGTGTPPPETDPGTNGGGGSSETPKGKVYNNGTYVDLPANTRGIAAVGQYALIVEMLGGKGALVAADANWLAQMRATPAAFSNNAEERAWIDSGIATGWSGSGTTAGTINIRALKAAGADTVLVGANSEGLSQADANQLTAAGINVVVMPAIGDQRTADADIVKAVLVVGELLKDAGTAIQYNAKAAAATYESMHDAAINNTLNANGGYSYRRSNRNPYDSLPEPAATGIIYQDFALNQTSYISTNSITTCYVDSWTFGNYNQAYIYHYRAESNTYYDIRLVDISDGFGLAKGGTSPYPNGWFFLSDYLFQVAGIQDNGPSQLLRTSTGASDRAVVSTGGLSTEANSSNPIIYYSIVTTVSGDGPPEWGSLNYFSPVLLGRVLVDGFSGIISEWRVGSDNVFPAVLARNATIANRMRTSAAKPDGYYNIGSPYPIYILPSGLAGSWADGTVESYLMAPWAYSRFRGQSLESASSYVNDFYRTFYRCRSADVLQDYNTTIIAGG